VGKKGNFSVEIPPEMKSVLYRFPFPLFVMVDERTPQIFWMWFFNKNKLHYFSLNIFSIKFSIDLLWWVKMLKAFVYCWWFHVKQWGFRFGVGWFLSGRPEVSRENEKWNFLLLSRIFNESNHVSKWNY
jgi:hypothetical protein